MAWRGADRVVGRGFDGADRETNRVLGFLAGAARVWSVRVARPDSGFKAEKAAAASSWISDIVSSTTSSDGQARPVLLKL
jgi:hypothetical protein